MYRNFLLICLLLNIALLGCNKTEKKEEVYDHKVQMSPFTEAYFANPEHQASTYHEKTFLVSGKVREVVPAKVVYTTHVYFNHDFDANAPQFESSVSASVGIPAYAKKGEESERFRQIKKGAELQLKCVFDGLTPTIPIFKQCELR